MIPSFASPLLLWGAAFIAVPVLIHLFNRRRFVVQAFAAMSFLQEAFARRRRRMRTENLLLLLLRCLVVLLAALAMALPFVPSDSPLSLMAGGRRELVLVVDQSGSMGRIVSPGTTVGDRVLEMVRRRISDLSDDRGDAVTLLAPGGAEILPAPIGSPPGQALAAIDTGLPPAVGVADMVDAARKIRDRVQPVRPGRLEIEIYTDLQAASWSEDVGPLLAEILDEADGSLRVIDVAADLPAPENVGVVSLAAQESLLLAGETITFTAVLRNDAGREQRGLIGSFHLDGVLKKKVPDIRIPPRGTEAVSLRLRIDAPGPHHLVFSLEPDELPFDDQRSLALEVRDTIDLLLVDGAPGPTPLQSSTGFLEMALAPQAAFTGGDDVTLSRYTTRVVDPQSLETAGRELLGYDAIVLSNVGGLTAASAEALADMVRSGTPLLVFTGDLVTPQVYGEQLESLGLLPATVLDRQGDPDGTGETDYVTLVLPDPPPPALQLFADPRLAVLLQVPVLAWNELVPHEDADVLALFADSLGHTTPAIVEGRLGLGRVILFATSADDSWSLLPRTPVTWLPLVHELVGALTGVDPGLVNVPVGHAPALVVDGRPKRARLELPSGAMEDIGRPEVEPLGELQQRSLLSLNASPLEEPGAFTLLVDIDDAAGTTLSIALAALPDAREGDLERIDTATLEERLAGVDFVLGEPLGEDGELDLGDSGDGSLFRFLLWALLVVIIGESLLARTMGGRR